LSGAESGEESSDSESARLPARSVTITPKSTKKTKSDYTFELALSEASEAVEVISEASSTEKELQVIDVNPLRSEIKGLDTGVKLDLSPSTVQSSDTNMDVYEFEDEVNETPKPKTFISRSPDRREELSAKGTDPVATQTEPVPVPDITVSMEDVKNEAEDKVSIIESKHTTVDEVAIPEKTGSVISPAIESTLPPVESLEPCSVIPTTETVKPEYKCGPTSLLSEVVTPVAVQTIPLPSVPVEPDLPALKVCQ